MKQLAFPQISLLPWQIKLVVLMFAMALIPGLIISYNITGLIRDELKSNIDGQIIFSANSVATNVDSKVKGIIETVSLIKNVFENPNLDSDQKIAFLSSSVEKIDNILSIVIAVKTKNGFDEAVSTHKEYIKTKGKQVIPLADNLEKVNLQSLSTEITNPFYFTTPEYKGNVKTWISTLIMKSKIPRFGASLIIAQIDFAEIAREVENHFLNKAGFVFITDESGKKFLTSKLLTIYPAIISNEAISLLKSNNRITIVNNYIGSAKKKFVTSFSYTQNINWVVVASIPEEIAYSVVYEAFIFFSVFILISVVLSIITALLFSRHLSRPIVKMADASKLIASGNFDVSLDYKADDSIGLLVNSLTSMGGQLKRNFDEIAEQKNLLEDYARNLEIKVEERTTELSESNKELKKAYRRVLELNEDKNEFLGIAAHDLKNPLIAISSFAEILREDKELPPEQHANFLTEIEKTSKRMFSIVKNLLDVNAIEQGKLNTNLEKVSIRTILIDLQAQFKEEIVRKNLVVVESFDYQDCEVYADRNLILQVFQNILSNAVKFSPADKRIFITVTSSKDNLFTEIRIKDEGPGFTESDKEKLFQKFARLSARPTGGEDSTGLGLSIVKKMVEMMNGTVILESENGKGSEFIISFPKAIINADDKKK
jgi:signal transduction histidine kinase